VRAVRNGQPSHPWSPLPNRVRGQRGIPRAGLPSARDAVTLLRIDLYGWITYTEFASDDPRATQLWASAVLGWTFREPSATPAGDHRLYLWWCASMAVRHLSARIDQGHFSAQRSLR
jgi:hypothetical protein